MYKPKSSYDVKHNNGIQLYCEAESSANSFPKRPRGAATVFGTIMTRQVYTYIYIYIANSAKDLLSINITICVKKGGGKYTIFASHRNLDKKKI